MAIPALFAAADPHPLRAAIDAVHSAALAFGGDYRSLLDEVWHILGRLVKEER